jgi:PDZ domain-containing protein
MAIRNDNRLSMVRRIYRLLLLLAVSSMISLCLPSFAAEVSAVGTAPFILDDNRMFAELEFVRPDGTQRKVFAFVDLGTPLPVVSDRLFKEMQVDQTKRLVFRIGGIEIQVDSHVVQTDFGSSMTGPNGKKTVPVEAVLPGSVLKDYQVIFDYARHSLTIARPNTLKGRGFAVPCRVNDKTGLISIAAVVDGHQYALAVDSGSAYSWLRRDITQQWVKAHLNWERGKGAVGESNMQTRPDGAEAAATILRLPEISIGSLRLTQIGVLGIAPNAPPFPPIAGELPVSGDFFDWYSKKAPEPVIGWLGGNVLKGFRLMIDFPRHMTYWKRTSSLDAHDLDQVGITLETRGARKGYFIAGVAEKDDKPTVAGVQPGDKLVQVDGLSLANATRGAVFSALHGKPGTVRLLLLERNGKEFRLRARVSAF